MSDTRNGEIMECLRVLEVILEYGLVDLHCRNAAAEMLNHLATLGTLREQDMETWRVRIVQKIGRMICIFDDRHPGPPQGC